VGAVPFAFSPAKGTVRSSLFAYDGDNLIEEANSSGTEVASYSQGLNIDEPLAMDRSSVASFYEADGLGSVTSLSSSAGALAETHTRDSFGKQTGSTGSITNPFQYTGREFDTETSLYYYRARYYDPTSGRFISEDPLGWDVGPNYYSYVDNSPLFLLDPSGLAPCKIDAKCRANRTTPLRIIRIGTLGIVNIKHCYIGVTDSNGDTFIISAGPDPHDFHRMTSGIKPLRDSDEKNNFTKDKSLKLNCSNGDDSCHQVDCLKAAGQAFQNNFPVYDYRGQKAPNSNSFTNLVTQSCGLKYSFPRFATGSGFKP